MAKGTWSVRPLGGCLRVPFCRSGLLLVVALLLLIGVDMRLTSAAVVCVGSEENPGKPDANGAVRMYRKASFVDTSGVGGGLLPVVVEVPEGVSMPSVGAQGTIICDAVGGFEILGERRNFARPSIDSLRLVELRTAGAK